MVTVIVSIIYRVLYVSLVSNWHFYGKFKTDYNSSKIHQICQFLPYLAQAQMCTGLCL